MGVAPAGHNEALHTSAFANDKPAIWRKCRPAFTNEFLFRGIRRGKKPGKARCEIVENRPVRLDWWWLPLKRIQARINAKRGAFPAAKQQAVVPYATVKSEFRDTKARQIGREAGHRHGNKILVPDRNYRQL